MRKNAQESLWVPVPCGSGALYTYKGCACPAKTVPVVWLGFLDSGTLGNSATVRKVRHRTFKV